MSATPGARSLPWRDVIIGPEGHAIYTSLTLAETVRLEALVSDGRRVLEVGSAFGFSAVVMALAGACEVLAVDPHAGELAGSLEVMQRNLARFGVSDRVRVVRSKSQHALPALVEQGERFGLVFLDGDHGDAVSADVRDAVRLLEKDGTLAVHDYTDPAFPAIREAVDGLHVRYFEIVDTLWVGVP